VNTVAPQLLDIPANRATFPAEVMTHAVAPEAIAGVNAFLVSDAAAPGERGDTSGVRRLSRTQRTHCAGRTEASSPDGLRLPGERHADTASSITGIR
jgi:hypothetical protein